MRFSRLLVLCLSVSSWSQPARAQPPGAAAERRAAPVDQLRAEAIDAEDRKFLSIDGLVGLVRGHNRSVASMAFSPDGQWLASSSWDNTVRLWKLGQAEPKDWATLEASPSGIAFHPDSRLLATGSAGTGVYLWDLAGEKPKRRHALAGHKQRPFALAFAPTGRMLASGCFDPLLRLWKLEDEEPEAWGVLVGAHAPTLGIASLAFSHDGKRLVAGCHLGKQSLRVWDAGGAFLEEIEMPPARARLVACSPTEPVLAFSGDDSKIHLWRLDGNSPKELWALPGHAGRGLPPAVKALAFSPTGKSVASSGQDRRLTIWDVATGEKQREWHLLDEVRAVAFSSDGGHLATGNDDGSTYLLRFRAK